MQRSYGPFNYENYLRNAEMMQKGFKPPLPFNSGTTVVGIVFNGGVMIGTDTRGMCKGIISTSVSQKLHRLHSNVYCGGSGYASDLMNITGLISTQLEVHYRTINCRCVPVVCAKQLAKEALMRHLGQIMASFVLAGVDRSGTHLYSVHFDGTSEKCLFNSIGSGQFSAMGLLEHRWQKDMNEAAARELLVDAVSAGIKNDLSSGSTVDLVIVRNDYSVQRCNEVLYSNLRSAKMESACPQNVTTQTDPHWMRNITVLKEQVIMLSLPKSPSSTSLCSEPSTSQSSIRCAKVRRTAANTRLLRKRPVNRVEDSEPPIKKMKTD